MRSCCGWVDGEGGGEVERSSGRREIGQLGEIVERRRSDEERNREGRWREEVLGLLWGVRKLGRLRGG